MRTEKVKLLVRIFLRTEKYHFFYTHGHKQNCLLPP